jgi:WD40 repeat protein
MAAAKKTSQRPTKVHVNKSGKQKKLRMLLLALFLAGLGAYLGFQSFAATPNGRLLVRHSGNSDRSERGLYFVNGTATEKTYIPSSNKIGFKFAKHPTTEYAAWVDGSQYLYPSNGTGDGRVSSLVAPDAYTTFFKSPLCATNNNYLREVDEMTFRTSVLNNNPRIAYIVTNTPDCNPNPSPNARTVYQIYASNADGSERVKLHESTNILRNIVWSADTSRIYWISNSNLVMRVGGELQTLATDAESFSLSGDGTKIAYLGSNGAKIMNADGSGKKRLPYNLNTGIISKSALSKKGTTLLTMAININGGVNAVQSWRTDRTESKILAQSKSAEYSTVDWSPNGDKIAYSYYDSTLKLTGVNTINVDGSGKVIVWRKSNPEVNADNFDVAW